MFKMVFLLFALTLGSVPVLGQNDSDAEVRSRILALENVWNLAVQNRDTRWLDALFDNSLVYIEHDGELMTKAEYLSTVGASGANPEQVLTEKMRAQVYGTTVVVTGIFKEKGVKERKPYQRHGRFIDTWVYKERERPWLCVAAQPTLMSR